MKKYLLPQQGEFYKANLHCHSTESDGGITPQQLKEVYQQHGYSIIAYTDHRKLIDHSDLTDQSFLALKGYELDFTEELYPEQPFEFKKSSHFNLIAKSLSVNSEAVDAVFDGSNHTPESVNRMIHAANKSGFLVTYNHSRWSLANYTDYIPYEGLFAMEIYNYVSCVWAGIYDYTPHIYEDMLRAGKRLYCIAADDNHNIVSKTDPLFDSFGGWTMIKAENLQYDTIISAMERGDFYASHGPVINSLYVEDNTLHITCEPAAEILFCQVGRNGKRYYDEAGNLTEAEFALRPEQKYVWVSVRDIKGNWANTHAYFLDEIL